MSAITPDSHIDELFLPARTRNVLLQNEIFRIGQLVQLKYIDLLRVPGLGKKSIRDVRESLSIVGLYIRDDWEDADMLELFMAKSAPVNDATEIETVGPAFPVTPTDRSGQIADTEMGMTLRDYFAAKALPEVMAAYDRNSADDDYTVWDEKNKRLIAITAYDFADAMLEARK